MLTSRKLKIASKKYNNQSSVWSSVSEQQEKLNSNVSHYTKSDVDVKSTRSASSLELTLDNKDLQQMRAEYKSHFTNLLKDNTIGFAYAINGELCTVVVGHN